MGTPFDRLTPSEQIAQLMRRIYLHSMTTTSGGNLSLRGEDGGVWISPSGTDKGTLTADDVVCVRPDGSVIGRHKPSVEYPFHRAVYERRPDLRALVHAHPADLVAFSIVRKTPETSIIPQAQQICGRVGFAPYAIPGSELLGRNISGAFAEGADCVLLENHGVVCGGNSLLHAFHRFETLDYCARLHVQARHLGTPRLLDERQLALFDQKPAAMEPFAPGDPDERQSRLRLQMRDTVHRAYNQHLMTSTDGTLSARLSPSDFLITPRGLDRYHLAEDEIVLMRDGQCEAGKLPSRATALHQAIYERHPDVNAILTAQPPHVMAFAVTDTPFDIRMIPESYFVLKDVLRLPFDERNDHSRICGMLGRHSPCVMIENDALLTTGSTLLQAFDRLEVAEFTARSILHAKALGGAVAMSDEQVAQIRAVFF